MYELICEYDSSVIVDYSSKKTIYDIVIVDYRLLPIQLNKYNCNRSQETYSPSAIYQYTYIIEYYIV